MGQSDISQQTQICNNYIASIQQNTIDNVMYAFCVHINYNFHSRIITAI